MSAMLGVAGAAAERAAGTNSPIAGQSLAAVRRLDAHGVRRQVAVIDALLYVLEERHLSGDRRVDEVVAQWLRRLGDEVALPLPREVVRARDTIRLHGALLDWMETVLDELIPGRRGTVNW